MTRPEGSWILTLRRRSSVSLKRITPASRSVWLTSMVIETSSKGMVRRTGFADDSSSSGVPMASTRALDIRPILDLIMVVLLLGFRGDAHDPRNDDVKWR